jgi:hypothetical protein
LQGAALAETENSGSIDTNTLCQATVITTKKKNIRPGGQATEVCTMINLDMTKEKWMRPKKLT